MDIHRCRFVDYTPFTITASAFSHNSDPSSLPSEDLRLSIGRADGSIEIWNPNPHTGNHDNGSKKWLLENTIPGGKGRSVEGLVWAQGNTNEKPRLFSIGGSAFITEWDIVRGIPKVNYDCNSGTIWSISISPEQDKLAVGCENGSVIIVDISGGPGSIEYETVLQRQQNRVLSLCWYGKDILVGGCSDGRIRCWSYGQDNENNNRIISTMRVDKSKNESTLVWSLVAIPQRNQLVSGDTTGSIKFWDMKYFVLEQSFQVHEADVLCLTVNAKGDKLFSGGVDRKIHNFNHLYEDSPSGKWVHSSNRLLHGNDIRTMSSFEAKGMDLLVSGGVERIAVINSMNNFQNGPSNKLPIKPFHSNLIVNSRNRLVVMWQNQSIKIWRLGRADETKKLVCKMTLSDDENIVSCSISQNGRYLVVARMSTIKLFELIHTETAIKVVRVNSNLLENFGAKLIKFNEAQEKILFVTYDNEVYSVSFNTEDNEDDEEDISEFDDAQTPVQYLESNDEDDDAEDEILNDSTFDNINSLEIDEEGKFAAYTQMNGNTYLLDLISNKVTKLIKLSDIPSGIIFSSNGTLLITTFDHKLLEFDIQQSVKESTAVLSKWSKINSDELPAQFVNLHGQPYGMSIVKSTDTALPLDRAWIFGYNWICFFDLNFNLNSSNTTQPPSTPSKKRTRNGNVVNGSSQKDSDNSSKAFWHTNKYKNLLYLDTFDNTKAEEIDEEVEEEGEELANRGGADLIVVERPFNELTPSTPAFKLNKITV